MTDQDLARLQLGVYGMALVPWDLYQNGGAEDVVYGVKVVEGVTVVVFRGSITLHDWLRDAFAWVNPVCDSRLGPVHPGFLQGMQVAWRDIKTITSGPRVFVGHSLGAARATVLAGLAVLDGQPPLARVVWGEPKSGFKKLADLIGGVPSRSYRNTDGRHHDLVTDVPLSFPPEEYVRCGHTIDVCAPAHPGLLEKYGIFGLHHFDLYASATPDTPV